MSSLLGIILKKKRIDNDSKPASLPTALVNVSTWNFDIDKYLNHFVPAPRWRLMPYFLAHFLGYRHGDRVERLGNIAMCFWAFIGVFSAILLVELASQSIAAVEQSGMLIVGSFGAAAVLEFYTIESPLAQPRNSVLGQLVSVTVGVSICKLFALSPQFESIRWIGGALACATATVVMALTKTVHPPAGATALLAVVDHAASGLGWTLIPVVLLGCTVMLATALLVNNIQSRFPSYWWTPENLGRRLPSEKPEKPDIEQQSGTAWEDEGDAAGTTEIVLRKGAVIVCGHISMSPEEKILLETISGRL